MAATSQNTIKTMGICKRYVIASSILLFFQVMLLFSFSTACATDTLSSSHSSGSYNAGADLTVTMAITYTGAVTALGVDVTLPDQWTYVSTAGDKKPDLAVQDGQILSFAWITVPQNPCSFSYVVHVPQGTEGLQSLSALVKYRRLAGELTEWAIPNPLPINSRGCLLTVNVDPFNSGTVARSPLGTCQPGICIPEIDCLVCNYTCGTTVSLTANPIVNFTFGGWSGACTGLSNTCNVNIINDLSVTATFNACALPVTPTLISPVHNISTVLMTPKLDWEDVAGAVNYEVQVCGDNACASVVRFLLDPITDSHWLVSPGLNENTSYWWRVRAANTCGNSPWSVIRKFSTREPECVLNDIDGDGHAGLAEVIYLLQVISNSR